MLAAAVEAAVRLVPRDGERGYAMIGGESMIFLEDSRGGAGGSERNRRREGGLGAERGRVKLRMRARLEMLATEGKRREEEYQL
eukprot:760146-Hanusia_phi.AAC.1